MKEKVRHTIEEKKKERAGLFPSSRANKKKEGWAQHSIRNLKIGGW